MSVSGGRRAISLPVGANSSVRFQEIRLTNVDIPYTNVGIPLRNTRPPASTRGSPYRGAGGGMLTHACDKKHNPTATHVPLYQVGIVPDSR